MSWVHGVYWWGHSKIHKNDTSKALQCTHHIVLLSYATIKLAKLKIVNNIVTSIIEKWGKLWRILPDMFKCTEVGLSYMCNNISTPMAPLLCIRLRRDLQLDFLTCAITFQHQWLLCSARLRRDLQLVFLMCVITFRHQWLLCSALD